MPRLLLLAPLVLCGCATQAKVPVTIDQVPPGSTCQQSSVLETYVGQPASAELGARLMAASRARTVRWVRHGTMVTMEFNPIRLTVRLDQQNRVLSATCG